MKPLHWAVTLLAASGWTFAAESPADEADVKTSIEGSVAVVGGTAFVHGDGAAFQERAQRPSDTSFGGLEELRYRREGRDSTLFVEGRAVAGEGDYGLRARWNKNERVYLDLGYDQFRTFYDGSGGYYPGNGMFFSIYDERLHVNRGHLWVEVGFTPEDFPHFVLRYDRLTRRGEKPSTEWGDTNLTGGVGARSIVPSFYELDEVRHIVSFDVSRETPVYQWNVGMRVEHSEVDDTRQNRRRPNETQSRAVTSKDDTETNLFTTHAYYERKLGEKLRVSAGALATTLDTNIDGSRIYGDQPNSIFDSLFARRQAGDLGFFGLGGGTQLKQYVGTLNAVYQLSKYWTLSPSVRYEHLHTDNVSTFIATNVVGTAPIALQSMASQSQKQEDKFTEVLEARYTGRPSWVYTFKAEWMQSWGDLDELQRDATTNASLISRATDYERYAQKYSLGAIWYARPGLTFSSEYYYRLRINDYNATRDSTPAGSQDRYPAFITNQDFSTHDFNLRMTWRPATQVSLVTRYDLQYSEVQSGFMAIPQGRSARATAHIVSQSVTWTPIPRLYAIASANLTYDQLATPAAAFVLNSDNNYLTGNLSAGYALGKATDVLLEYDHYRARDFSNNSSLSLPYGADQTTQSTAVTWIYRQSSHLIYTVKYAYATNRDRTSGNRNDFRAHVVYAKVQYKF